MNIPEINNLAWSEARLIPTRFGPKRVKSATPAESFWNLWRANKQELKDAGFSVGKLGLDWVVSWWERDGEFHYPVVADVEAFTPVAKPDVEPLRYPDNLKPWQPAMVQTIVAAMKHFNVSLNAAGTGVGKCLGEGTLVTMFDGSTKAIENVVAGDRLMGDDSSPRNVESVSRGFGSLFLITPNKGVPWVCNANHILSLCNSEGKIIDIPLNEYLKKSKKWKHLFKQYAVPLFLKAQKIPFDPYIYGMWIADGTIGLPSICKARGILSDYLESYFKSMGYNIRGYDVPEHNTTQWSVSHKYGTNEFRRFCAESSDSDKFIYREYLVNQTSIRAELLAAILDCDGHLSNGCFDLVTRSKHLSIDYAFLARSLGFHVKITDVQKSCKTGAVGNYHRLTISGDFRFIPFKIHKPDRRMNKNPLATGFTVTQIADGRYYGIVIDGNRRFLLHDMTVTHNTYVTLAASRERGRRIVVVCPKPITIDWERAAAFMGVELAGVFGWEWMKTGKTDFAKWSFRQVKQKSKKVAGDYVLVNKKDKFEWTIPSDCDLVFDECHRSAAMDTQNSMIVRQAVESKIPLYLLSATIADDPTKMRAVGFALGLHGDGKDFYSWMSRYGVVQTKWGYQFQGGARHLQAIHQQIFPAKGVRVRGEDLGDMFPRNTTIAKAYDMDEGRDISQAYDEMFHRIAELEDQEMDAASRQACILVEILRARQRVELLKVPLMVSLTRDANEEGNSMFLAVNFRDTLQELVRQLNIQSIICGNQKPGDRRMMIDNFQANKVQNIAGIIKACREGLNLHDLHGHKPRGSLIMPTPSAFDLKQVLGRIHRAGGLTPCFQRILFAAKTIEEDVCENLATKLDRLDLVMDGDLQKGIFPNKYSEMRPQGPDKEDEELIRE